MRQAEPCPEVNVFLLLVLPYLTWEVSAVPAGNGSVHPLLQASGLCLLGQGLGTFRMSFIVLSQPSISLWALRKLSPPTQERSVQLWAAPQRAFQASFSASMSPLCAFKCLGNPSVFVLEPP